MKPKNLIGSGMPHMSSLRQQVSGILSSHTSFLPPPRNLPATTGLCAVRF
uniref:Uncharacterized protein n=1 Tax=Utricularia reniformis TaxID=192314 RepID=A0A1Y0B026_9LAMI|nr:hypothetical protein AEK19_MT0469 [Utricularia reniformis]ART30728.1 hypothetical protein AEK19_MT0469 [Utricularia reniformis]